MMDAANLQNFVQFLLPTGRAALVEMVREFKTAYGANWIVNFKAENPDASFLVDIVANHDAPAAFLELRSFVSELIDEAEISAFEKMFARSVATATLNGNYSHILETHKALREEMDKPRF